MRDAQADLASGSAAYHLSGKPSQKSKNFARILDEKYDVKVGRTAWCCLTTNQSSYDTAYSRVLKQSLQGRLGFDPIERSWAEAGERQKP